MTAHLSDAFFGRLEALSLHLKSELAGYFGGRHPVKRYGQTAEFADFREYRPGDDIRRIDWNLYARFRKYFLKLFADERQMHVRIFLDCSASMDFYPGKAEYALSLAAALGFLAVQSTDRVSFHLLWENRAIDPFGTIAGKRSFFAAVGALERTRFGGEADFATCIPMTAVGRGDGLSVLITDLLTENNWKRAVEFLLYRGQQVLLLQVLDREERAPSYSGRLDLVDAEALSASPLRMTLTRRTLEDYDDAFRDWSDEIKHFCRSRGVDFLSADTRTPVEKTIFRDLLGCDLVR